VREGRPITLAPNSEPEPDIAVVRPLGEGYRQRHPYAEDVFLLIEFSNTSLAKDLKPKRQLYAAAEIPEYWVVNLKVRQLVVFRDSREGDYHREEKLSQGMVAPLAFPEVVISVSRLLGL
jgi:Uma2 family endonuclease